MESQWCNSFGHHQVMRSIVCVLLFVACLFIVITHVIAAVIIILIIRYCFLISPLYRSAVVLFDRRFPCFRNVEFIVTIVVFKFKSCRDCLFDPTFIPVGIKVTISQIFNFLPSRNLPSSLTCSETAEVCVWAGSMSLLSVHTINPNTSQQSHQLYPKKNHLSPVFPSKG